MQRIVIDAVIAPGRDHDTCSEADDRAGALAARVDHPQSSSEFSIPTDKWMHRGAPIDILESVIAPLDHVQKSARRPASWIILCSKKYAVTSHPQSERVPKALGDSTQSMAFFGAMKNTSLASTS
jgi:hypothetical protein